LLNAFVRERVKTIKQSPNGINASCNFATAGSKRLYPAIIQLEQPGKMEVGASNVALNTGATTGTTTEGGGAAN